MHKIILDLSETHGNQQSFNSSLGSIIKDMSVYPIDVLDEEGILDNLQEFLQRHLDSGNKILNSNKKNLSIIFPEKVEDFGLDECVDNSKRAFDALVASKYASKFKNACQRNIEFDLTFSDMRALMRKTNCEYTGVKFDNNSEELRQSIERIDESLGYVKGNVAAVTVHANNFKSLVMDHGGKPATSMTLEELTSFVSFLNAHRKALGAE